MLETIRNAAKTWVAQALFAVLVVSFAIWGMGDVASGFSNRAASVGDQAVDGAELASAIRREQQRFGVDPAKTREVGLDRYVLGGLVREAAFNDQSTHLGLSVGDQALAAEVRLQPGFQSGGAFDPVAYRAMADRNFGGVQAFEDRLRAELASNLLKRAALAGAGAPQAAAGLMAAHLQEQRGFDVFTLPLSAAPEPDAPDDAALQAYLDAHADQFAEPERRDVSWLRIDPARLGEGLEISEEDIRAAYDGALDRFVSPERREIDQIIYPDQASAEAAMARAMSGDVDFDALLTEQGLARADAALGQVKPGDLRDARGEAAFATEIPGLVGPAQTASGWAILDIHAIHPGATTSYEEAREALRAEIATSRAAPDADRLVETVEDLRAGGASLEEIAAELKLDLGKISGLARDGKALSEAVDGLIVTQTFLDDAFDAARGEERDFHRSELGGWFTLRVDEIIPSRIPELTETHDRVAQGWRRDQRRAALREIGEAAAERIVKGEEIASVAADWEAPVERISPLRRIDAEPRLGAEARARLFAKDAAPGAAAITAQQDSVSVAALTVIEAPGDIGAVERAVADELDQSFAQDQLDYLGRALEQAAGVSLNPTAIDAAVSAAGG